MRPGISLLMAPGCSAVPAETERKSDSSLRWVHPGNAALRRAVQDNVVSFPSQVPVLSRSARPDMQWRIVTLYVVRGWPVTRIAARYGLPAWRISQVIHDWSVRAFAAGHIQVIDLERFSALTGQRQDDEATPGGLPQGDFPPPAAAGPKGAAKVPAAVWGLAAAQDSVLDALDLTIQRCDVRQGAFWSRTARALRKFRSALEAMERTAGQAAGDRRDLGLACLQPSAGRAGEGRQRSARAYGGGA